MSGNATRAPSDPRTRPPWHPAPVSDPPSTGIGTTADVASSEGIVPFHTFLLKIASRCNLNCSYCYVYHSPDQSWRAQPKLMSRETVTRAAERIYEHCSRHGKRDAAIVFHGGEPLMGGIAHLEMLTDVLGDAFSDGNVRISVGIQSNGLLFTPQIGDFLLDRGVSIGVSLDGPPRVNDRFRVDHLGRPTSARLEERLGLLTSERYRSIFSGFLCVVDPETDPIEVTDYLQSFDPVSVDYLFPLDNWDRRPRGKEHDASASPYGDWLIRSFDHWFSGGGTMRVRLFNSIVGQIFGYPSLMESIGLHPVDLVVVETNGEIEGVDSLKSAFSGATRLGYNIFDDSFDTVAVHHAVRSRQLRAASLCDTCRRCPVVDVCGGGYLPHRYSADRGFDNPSVYCSDLQALIRHIHAALARELDGATA